MAILQDGDFPLVPDHQDLVQRFVPVGDELPHRSDHDVHLHSRLLELVHLGQRCPDQVVHQNFPSGGAIKQQ